MQTAVRVDLLPDLHPFLILLLLLLVPVNELAGLTDLIPEALTHMVTVLNL